MSSDRDIAHDLREQAQALTFSFDQALKRVSDKALVLSAARDTKRCLDAFLHEHQEAVS